MLHFRRSTTKQFAKAKRTQAQTHKTINPRHTQWVRNIKNQNLTKKRICVECWCDCCLPWWISPLFPPSLTLQIVIYSFSSFFVCPYEIVSIDAVSCSGTMHSDLVQFWLIFFLTFSYYLHHSTTFFFIFILNAWPNNNVGILSFQFYLCHPDMLSVLIYGFNLVHPPIDSQANCICLNLNQQQQQTNSNIQLSVAFGYLIELDHPLQPFARSTNPTSFLCQNSNIRFHLYVYVLMSTTFFSFYLLILYSILCRNFQHLLHIVLYSVPLQILWFIVFVISVVYMRFICCLSSHRLSKKNRLINPNWCCLKCAYIDIVYCRIHGSALI